MQQLRKLAEKNGTLRDDENQACHTCGMIGHRRLNCPQRNVITNTLICNMCGTPGHIARDCKYRNDPAEAARMRQQHDASDVEYRKLMAEVGGGVAPNSVSSLLHQPRSLVYFSFIELILIL